MNNFRIGQKVVCVHRGPWKCSSGHKPVDPPNYGDVVTIKDIIREDNLIWLVFWEKTVEDMYNSNHFRPTAEFGNFADEVEQMVLPQRVLVASSKAENIECEFSYV